jgi:hypothetical protein
MQGACHTDSGTFGCEDGNSDGRGVGPVPEGEPHEQDRPRATHWAYTDKKLG